MEHKQNDPRAPFWTRQGRQLGTAHRSRTGAIVDFRPVSGRPSLCVLADGTTVFRLFPPEGVEIDPLVVPAACTAREIVLVKETWQADFEGIAFSDSCVVPAEEAFSGTGVPRGKAPARLPVTSDRQPRSSQGSPQGLRSPSPAEFSALSQPTKRERGRLGGPYWKDTMGALIIRACAASPEKLQGAQRPFGLDPLSKYDDGWCRMMRAGLLALYGEERAQRKNAFLAAASSAVG